MAQQSHSRYFAQDNFCEVGRRGRVFPDARYRFLTGIRASCARHIVFTLPAPLRAIAYHNKAKVYGLLFTAAAETLTTIAADPRHLGANIGVTAVLHTWGQSLDHHPHVHCIVLGGGISADGRRWVRSRPRFLVPVRVLSALFRRLYLAGLAKLHADGELQFFGDSAALADAAMFEAHLARLAMKWVVYAKRPFAGPAQVLAYLARYTHRVAISNRRLLEIGDDHVSFRWKDYREDGSARSKVMRLTPAEFMRRFLLHVLPDGFHRIRHYGLFANGHRAEKLALCRRLLDVAMVPHGGKNEAGDAGKRPDETARATSLSMLR
jgi:hypothetical protein